MQVSRRVYVVDDEPAVRESVAAVLEAAGYSVQSFASAVDFLKALPAAAGGVLVTDVRMPEVSGLELLRRLGDARARFPTVVLTGAADVPMAVECLKSGAVDFIEKPYPVDLLLGAVRAALAQLEARAEGEAQAHRLASLSPRERQVLDGIIEGKSNKLIARDHGLSPRTVEAYRANLMDKLGVGSVAELVQVAMGLRRP